MQTAGGVNMRWFPVHPLWIIATGIVVLAAMPHQLGARAIGFLTSPLGILVGVGGAGWLFGKIPVLGVAVAMLVFAANIIPGAVYERFTGSAERFTGSASRERFTPTINRDVVQQKHHWLQEDILSEDPHVIQERTENPTILYDRVEENGKWEDEQTLGQNPLAIQERPVPEFDDNYSPYR
jgi:hypothetical protein